MRVDGPTFFAGEDSWRMDVFRRSVRRLLMSGSGSKPEVVAVVGSPRRHGNTVTLVDAALEELERSGCRCTRIMLDELHIEACDGHANCGELEACPQDDDMAGVLDKVYAADGLILASPVYYENVSAQMKTFIDRNATRYFHEEWLAPRVVGLIAVGAESTPDDTWGALRRFIALSNPEEVPVVTMGGCADQPGDAAKDPDLMDAARTLGRSMAEALGLPGE
jgi:multimeric flavodoxin WrbA